MKTNTPTRSITTSGMIGTTAIQIVNCEVDMLEIINWLANGETGMSSETMAFTAMGVKYKNACHPYDPADFNRCLLLLEAAPIVRQSFPKIRELSPEWAAIIDHWDELERLFLDEAGRDWSKAQRAPKTYERMLQLRGEK